MDLDNYLASCLHKKNMRTYHTKEVSGNDKHAQKSTEDNPFWFCEAISHCLNFSIESKLALFATKMKLAASDAEERRKAAMANVRG